MADKVKKKEGEFSKALSAVGERLKSEFTSLSEAMLTSGTYGKGADSDEIKESIKRRKKIEASE